MLHPLSDSVMACPHHARPVDWAVEGMWKTRIRFAGNRRKSPDQPLIRNMDARAFIRCAGVSGACHFTRAEPCPGAEVPPFHWHGRPMSEWKGRINPATAGNGVIRSFAPKKGVSDR